MGNIEKIALVCFSDKGTVRRNNEDNMYSSFCDIINYQSEDCYFSSFTEDYNEKLRIVAVFDGIGGMEGGELASLISAKQMSGLYEKMLEKKTWSNEELLYMLLNTKKQMEQKTRAAMNISCMDQPGTTCCGFFMKNGSIKPFWIGDSRLYLLRGSQLILLTKDHTIAQERIDYGLITPEEATTVRSWHYITSYIGDNRNNFTLGDEFTIEPGDKYLLCTDGISDQFSADKLAVYMSKTPIEFAELISKEIKIASNDNATAIMMQLIPKEEKKRFKNFIKETTKEYFSTIIKK